MKLSRLLVSLALALGLMTASSACVAEYDDPGPAYVAGGCPVMPVSPGVFVEEPCVYYRLVYVDGVPYRHYYAWADGAWVYHGWVAWRGGGWVVGPGWRGPAWRGGWHESWHGSHGGWHGGGYHGGGHGGGRR